jgi:hypothetical protein
MCKIVEQGHSLGSITLFAILGIRYSKGEGGDKVTNPTQKVVQT